MKNLASAGEKERRKNKTISHRGFKIVYYSLWLIIFISVFGFINDETFSGELFFNYGEVIRTTCDNGLVVILKENHNLPLTSLFLCVRTGSAQEEEFSGSGISHFIEHMVFKGTEKRGVGDVFKEIESYGGTINGFTSYDYTGYKITVPAEFVFPALELLSDMIMNATFDEHELEKEREVVLKEIRLSGDDPHRYSSRLLWQTAYTVHPYRYPIIGEEDLFKKLTRKDLLQFHRKHYVPNNMILTLVGDINSDETLSYIKGLFKDYPKRPVERKEIKPEPEQKETRKSIEKFTAGLTYLTLGFHSVSLTDKDCFALDVLGAILGEGRSSRLYKLICDKEKLVYNIEAINYTPQQPGLFIISVLLEEKNRAKVRSLILDEIGLVKKKKVSEKELEAAKNKLISDIIFNTQTLEAQTQDLGLSEAITGDLRFTEKYVRNINKVTSEDILQAAQRHLDKNNLNIVALVPQEEAVKSGDYKNLEGGLSIGMEYLSRGKRLQNKKGEVEKYILDNGLRILIKENKKLPLISIKVVFKGGLRAEDEDSNGLCNLVAHMLAKGTKTKNASEIADLIESKGAHLSAFSGNNSFGLSLDLLDKDFDYMLALLADLIINPAFPQSELAKQKEKNLASLKTVGDNIFKSGIKSLKRTLFQKHPYGLLEVGNKKSLKKIKRRNLINFYQDYCVGKNMVMAIFGDIDKQEVLTKVKQTFGGFATGNEPDIIAPREPEFKSVRKTSKYLNKKQSLIFLGFPGTTVHSGDRYVLEVICQILSQASGRLFNQIREKSGLAYTLGAYQVLGLDPGYLVVYVATTEEKIERVKKELLKQLTALKQNYLSKKELEQAKRIILTKRLISRQTNSACALESALDELYGLGYDHYHKYPELINRIDTEDIARCARQYFDFKSYALVIVSPSAE